MSEYNKATNFTAKDSLPTGNAGKIVKGTEIDTEFTAIANAIASKADINSPAFTGTPTVPTASLGTNTTQIATTAFAIANGVPSGVILLWSGSIASIPTGWVLCNGSNSTPDLRNRFVVGAGSTYGVGATGGSTDATLVSHSHTYSGNTGGMDRANPHSHGILYGPRSGGSNGVSDTSSPGIYWQSESADINHEHPYSGTTSSIGSSATNANLPPYYALAYIMKS